MSDTAFATRFLAQHPHGYSTVVEAQGGRLVFITGQMALDEQGLLVGAGDFRIQTEQVFTNLKAALAVVGATFDHVVKITVLAETDFISHALTFAEIRDRHVNTENPPASAIILTPKLVAEGAMIDIAVIAHLPE